MTMSKHKGEWITGQMTACMVLKGVKGWCVLAARVAALQSHCLCCAELHNTVVEGCRLINVKCKDNNDQNLLTCLMLSVGC